MSSGLLPSRFGAVRSFGALFFLLFGLLGTPVGCSSSTSGPPAPVGETVSPKDSPLAYRVLADEADKAANGVEFHVLLTAPAQHDAVDVLLKYLYRHLMQRHDDPPGSIAAYVYTNESQYKTPPRSPIASLIKKQTDAGPAMENKVPLEFWQQVDQALPHTDKGWKLEKKIVRDDRAKTLVVTVPYTEPGMDRYAEKLSFNLAMNEFTDIVQALFDKVPELHAMTYIGRWKDEDVIKVNLDRTDYQALRLNDVEEQMGQLHGRAFLELGLNKGTDASVTKNNNKRMAAVYNKMLAQLKGKAVVSKALK